MSIECSYYIFVCCIVMHQREVRQANAPVASALILSNNGSPGSAARQVHYGHPFGC